MLLILQEYFDVVFYIIVQLKIIDNNDNNDCDDDNTDSSDNKWNVFLEHIYPE